MNLQEWQEMSPQEQERVYSTMSQEDKNKLGRPLFSDEEIEMAKTFNEMRESPCCKIHRQIIEEIAEENTAALNYATTAEEVAKLNLDEAINEAISKDYHTIGSEAAYKKWAPAAGTLIESKVSKELDEISSDEKRHAEKLESVAYLLEKLCDCSK